MATQAQIDANRLNAQSSTGPRTEAGKASSSQNAVTHGLFSRKDYVRPEEEDFYKSFCRTMHEQLAPANLVQFMLAEEISGAAWRLRRCHEAEAELGDYSDETDKSRRGIERARAAAHSVLHRSLNQLRKLKAESASNCQPTSEPFSALSASPREMASNCKPAQPEPQIARNAPCPCRSGEKYKRCCGKTAPPVLGKAA